MGPIVSAVATALSGVFASVFGLIFNVLGVISGAFLWLSVNIFNLVISPNFITIGGQPISYTNPAVNPFLEVGWSLTRDFANIIIVLALVVIGVGTTLRLAGYEAQKALPSLIIIALLINFTPVICGLFVDASNILMNFFVGEGFAGGNSFINLALNQWSNISSLAGGFKLWDPIASNEAIAAATASLVLVIFNCVAALVYLVFALLFFLRYIAIWVLVILSPIAFVCYILPNTRSVWSQWWQQFFQWSFIGVIAAFFLYLADHMMMATKEILFEAAQEVGNAPGLAPVINNIMPYGIVIVFMIIGLMLSLSSSAAGAKEALSFGQKAGGKVGGWVGKRGKAFARDKMPEGVRRWGERQAAAKKWGEGEKGFKGWAKRTVSSPIAGMRRGMGGLMATGFNERLDTEKSYKKAQSQDIASNLKDYRNATSEAEKTGIMRAMVEKKQLNDALDVKKFGKSALTEEELLKTYEKAVKMGDEDTFEGIERGLVGDKKITNSFATIRHKEDSKFDENGLTAEDKAKGYRDYNHKIIAQADTMDKMKQLRKGWHLNDENLKAYHLSASGNQISQATMLYGRSFSDKFVRSVQDRGTDWYFKRDELSGKMRNPDLPQYLASSGAMSLGIGLTDTNQHEIQQKALAGSVIEQHPELEDYYANYSDIRKFEKDIQLARRKGADNRDIETARNTAREKRESLDNKLHELYAKKPALEDVWDNLMERLESKKQRRRNR